MTGARVNGDVSFWYAGRGGPPPYRPALPGDVDADVCIVGAGYTGLWTAYYLAKAAPALRIVVLEREFAGFGASGRNGGQLTGGLEYNREKYAKARGHEAVVAMERALRQTVDEVIAVAAQEEIDADIVKGGILRVATNPAQWSRIRHEQQVGETWGVGPEEAMLLDRGATLRRVRVAGALGSRFQPDAARIQPAKLARGLAGTVERLGVPIYERTAVTELRAAQAVTATGSVRAPLIVRATEGFTPQLPGMRRSWLPMNSAIIVTDPLPDRLWDELGWAGFETLGDAAHGYVYAQRTADGRVAIGGRGVPYRYGSRTDHAGRTQDATIAMLATMLGRLFPPLRGAPIAHAWCGVLGVPRDWCATVGLDRRTGAAWAGGYVGLGLASSNLAGRTLRDLILDRETALTALPWVDRTVRTWEPEPLRWLGVHSLYRLYRAADALERRRRSGRTSGLARFADAVAGRK